MKVDQLLSFRCVADERSYTRAAERLFLTQPAVYSQVRQLEVECGAKLFYVHGKEVLLTPAGRELYTFASTVAAAFPGGAIFVLILALNLLGDGLRDALDPRQRRA